MKAREWLERGRQASSPIDGLRDFWTGFNNRYASNEKNNERGKIRTFLLNSMSPASAKEILAANSNEIEYLLAQPVIDMRGNGKDTEQYIKGFYAASDSLDKINHVFMIIYQVRCNLDHGQKSPNRDRDVRLCACSAPIVAAALERCV